MASLNSVCPHGCWRARLRKGSPAGLYVRPCPFWSPLMMFPSSHSALATLASSLTLTQVRRLLPQGLCTCCSHCLEDLSFLTPFNFSLLFLQFKLKRQFPCDISYSTQVLPFSGLPQGPSPNPLAHRSSCIGMAHFHDLSGPEPHGVPRTQCRQHAEAWLSLPLQEASECSQRKF